MIGENQATKVLLVDDNAIVRDMLVDLVASFGCAPEPAASGREALELFDRGHYDIVLTDLLMPGMSGWEVLEAVHERNPNMPVVIITGSPVVDDPRAAKRNVAVLKKPVDVTALENLVKRMVERRQPV
jgi:DNA-binding NtrC family response regulator